MMMKATALFVAMLAIAQGFVAPQAARSSTSLMAEPKKAANASFSYMDNLSSQTTKKAEEVSGKAEDAADDAKDGLKKAANTSMSYMSDLNAKTAEVAENVKEGVEDAVDEVAAAGKKVGHYLDK